MLRRDALSLLSSGIALAACSRSRASSKGAKTLNLETPEGRFRAFIMMRGALDDRLNRSWIEARYYGVVNGELTPLFGVASVVFSRYRKIPDGSFEAVSFEYAHFLDPQTGKAMDAFLNPYTLETVAVPTSGYKPSRLRISPSLEFSLEPPPPGLEMGHEVFPIEARGDDVWLTELTRTAFRPAPDAAPFRYSETFTLHASRNALEQPDAKQVTSEVQFTNVVGWRPWLKMGDRPGHMSAMGYGRQNAGESSIPPAWIEATEKRRPELLENPQAVLDAEWDAR